MITVAKTVHGESKKNRTRLYTIWGTMKSRCYNPNSKDYKNYGARGIVCDETWKKDYREFKTWAIQSGYNDELTLERIDVNQNYSPENCKWVSPKEQGRNRRTNKMLTYLGKTQCISAWCEELGLQRTTVEYRIRAGWDVERALTTPSLIPRKRGGSDETL